MKKFLALLCAAMLLLAIPALANPSISELKVTLLKDLPISRYTLMGEEVIPYFGLGLGNGGYEYIPLGVFTVSSAKWSASGVEITAYDNMAKLDRSFASSNLSGTPYELLKLACTSCGLALNMRERDFRSLANGTRILSLYADNDINTWRDCVSWIAQALACNVFADREGKIVLRSYGQDVTDRIDTEHRFTGSTFGDYETRYTGLSVVDIEDQMTVYFSMEVDDGLTYNLGSNPFLQSSMDQEDAGESRQRRDPHQRKRRSLLEQQRELPAERLRRDSFLHDLPIQPGRNKPGKGSTDSGLP